MSLKSLVRIHFRNPEDHQKQFLLDYDIHDMEFSQRWLYALKTDLERGMKPQNGGNFYGHIFVDPHALISAMNENIRIVNTHQNKVWIDKNVYTGMTHAHLMSIHDDFERLEPHPEFNDDNGCSEEVRLNLLELNLNIHRYECYFIPQTLFHIDLLLERPLRYEFKDEDFKLFTPNWHWGSLNVAYGVTGVPPFNSYMQPVKQTPVSQTNYTSGMLLNFEAKFQDWDYPFGEVDAFLKRRYGRTVSDPRLAFGLIPVGQLKNQFQAEELGELLKKHKFIHKIEILDQQTIKPLPEEGYKKGKVFIEENIHKFEELRELPCCHGQKYKIYMEDSPTLMAQMRSPDQGLIDLKFNLYNSPIVSQWLARLPEGLWSRLHLLNPSEKSLDNEFGQQIKIPGFEIKLTDDEARGVVQRSLYWGELFLVRHHGQWTLKVHFQTDQIPVDDEFTRTWLNEIDGHPPRSEDCEEVIPVGAMLEADRARKDIIDILANPEGRVMQMYPNAARSEFFMDDIPLESSEQ